MRPTNRLATLTALLFITIAPLAAQEAPEMSAEEAAMMQAMMAAATPGAPHAMLATRVGTYEMKVTSSAGPGAPPIEDRGTSVRSMELGGRVLVEKVNATMMGMPFEGRGRTGFDNVSGEYWGTWTDSMGTGIMVIGGDCDEKNHCEFVGSWNDPMTGQPIHARITLEVGDGREVFRMFADGPDGNEMKMMEIVYTKK